MGTTDIVFLVRLSKCQFIDALKKKSSSKIFLLSMGLLSFNAYGSTGPEQCYFSPSLKWVTTHGYVGDQNSGITYGSISVSSTFSNITYNSTSTSAGPYTFRRGALKSTKQSVNPAYQDREYELCLNHTPPTSSMRRIEVFEVGKYGYGYVPPNAKQLVYFEGSKSTFTNLASRPPFLYLGGEIYTYGNLARSESFQVDGVVVNTPILKNGLPVLPNGCSLDNTVEINTLSSPWTKNWFIGGNKVATTPVTQAQITHGGKTYEDGPYQSLCVVGPVNSAPVANSQNVEAEEGKALTFTLSATDADGDLLTYSVVNPPSSAHGSLTISGNKATFTPVKLWNGLASFTFKARDAAGADSNVASVNINVVAAQQSYPGFLQPTYFEVTYDDGSKYKEVNPGEIVKVQIKYQEPDTSKAIRIFGSWSVSQSSYFTARDNSSAILPVSGSLIKSSPETPHDCRLNSNAPCTNFSSLKTYDLEFKVSETMIKPSSTSYSLVDGQYVAVEIPAQPIPFGSRKINISPFWGPACNQLVPAGGLMYDCSRPINLHADLTLNVIGGNSNKNPIAQNVFGTVVEDQALPIALLAEDEEGDSLTYHLVDGPNGDHGSVTISGGVATFTPQPNWNGTTTFTYRANDGQGYSNTATVTVTVTPVNDQPTVNNTELLLDEDTVGTLTLQVTDVDLQFEGDSHTWSIVTAPNAAHGTASIAGDKLTFTPALNWYGTSTLTYRVRDAAGVYSNTATVTVTVNPVNDAPVVNNQLATTNEDTAAVITLLVTDVEPADTHTFHVVAQPNSAHGQVVISGNKATFTPALNWNGTTTFTFYGRDQAGAVSGTRTVTVTVLPVNDVPLAEAQGVLMKTLESKPVSVKYRVGN